MRHFFLISILIAALQLHAQNNALQRSKHFNLQKGVAIQGYDPVSYFITQNATAGKSTISENYQGVIYYFSSETNKKIFLVNPLKYEPQYGGWCAFAMGDYSKKVEIDPNTFKIIDGKLYLFYNAFLTNTLNSWNKNEKTLKAKADINWLTFLNNK